MTRERLLKICAAVMAVCVICVLAFYWIGGDQLRFRGVLSESVSPMSAVGEITADTELCQPFTGEGDRLEHVQVFFSTYGRENTASVRVQVLDGAGELRPPEPGKYLFDIRLHVSRGEDYYICDALFWMIRP